MISDKNDQKLEALAWQKTPPLNEDTSSTVSDPAEPKKATLDQAREFLRDESVQKKSPEEKKEFLKTKGLPESDVDELLRDAARGKSPDGRRETPAGADLSEEKPRNDTSADRPPIITYPEFLTESSKPPPLMTMNGFLHTVSAFAGLSTVVYGASKYVMEPMAQSLMAARISLHDTAKQDVGKLVEKLESTVSELPPPRLETAAKIAQDDASSYGDPTEVFHRDVGVQTSPPPSPFESSHPAPSPVNASVDQALRLTRLAASLRAVGDGFVSQSENYNDIKQVLEMFREDLDKITYPPNDFVGGYSLYGGSNKNEPDDEIKRAKENIRRVKGVLLSARSFPGTAR